MDRAGALADRADRAPAPRRTATISARIDTAISPGSSAPMSSPIGARTAASASSVDAVLEQPLAPPGLGLPRPHRPDVRRALLQRRLDRRAVEALVVAEHDHRVGSRRGRASTSSREVAERRPARRGDHRGERGRDRSLAHHQHVRDVRHVPIMPPSPSGVATRRVGAEMSTSFPIPGLESVAPAEPRTTRRGPTADELLEGLNEPQRAAVVHAGAPLLVVAGAGSGKTRVLTRRIAWLISERKAHPGSILAITFTNKAAAEMKERVEALVGKRARIMWVSTFHSACVRILRKEIDKFGYKSNFSIYDAADSKRLMTLVCRDLDLDPKRYQPNAVLHWVSNHKNELRDAEEATKDARNAFEETYAAAYTALPAAAARGERARLRRPDHDHGPPVPGVPRGARDLPAPVPPRARRRVPGHQPRAVRPDPPAVRRQHGGADRLPPRRR